MLDSALFGDEHRDYRESVRAHLERVVLPQAEAWDEAAAIPAAALHAAAEHGFIATRISERHGGLGLDDIRFPLIVAEEAMLAAVPSLALVLMAHDNAPTGALMATRQRAFAEAWLPRLASAEVVATSALHHGLTARRMGDGLVLDGTAHAVVGGVGAGLLVLAAREHDAPVVVALQRGTRGLRIVPSRPSIGLRAAGLADVSLEDVAVAPEAILAAGAGADRMLDDLLTDERVLLAVAAAAGGHVALMLTAAYVRDRRAFG
jgi:alkylation response protein AidB-like acyl-CoA dehydrogenase